MVREDGESDRETGREVCEREKGGQRGMERRIWERGREGENKTESERERRVRYGEAIREIRIE